MEEVDTPEVIETPAAPETPTAEVTRVEQEASAFQQWVDAKKAPLLAASETTQEEEVPPQEPPVPAVQEKEPASRAAKRLLDKERKLREDIAAKQAEWEAREEEWSGKISNFEQAREGLKYDPNAFIDSLGLTPEEKLQTARLIFFESQPELATPEVRAQMEEIKRSRWEKSVEAKLEAKQAPPEEEEKAPTGPTVQDYVTDLQTYAVDNVEKFPSVSSYIASNQVTIEQVQSAMYNAAHRYATEQNGKGAALTPEECMQQVESYLANQLTEEKPTPEAPKEKAPTATLRNSAAAPQTGTKKFTDLLSPEAKAHRRQLMLAKLMG